MSIALAPSARPPTATEPLPRTVFARALAIGDRIDTRGLVGERVAVGPLVLRVGARGKAVLFRYGCVVLFDVSSQEERAFLGSLATSVQAPVDHVEVEEVELSVAGAADGNQPWVPDANLETLQVVADVLAKSVVLAHYEETIAQVFDRIEPLAQELERRARTSRHAGKLVRHIAAALLVQHRMVGRVAVAESPELVWEHPGLERLYARFADEYEIRERDAALERKLALVSRTAELLLDLLQTRRSLRVEWYIVILIVVEIALMLYGMATGASG